MLRMLAVIVICLVSPPVADAPAQASFPSPEPDPDRVAWTTLASIVTPASIDGQDSIEFETWASDDDVYGSPLPQWPRSDSVNDAHGTISSSASQPRGSGSSAAALPCASPLSPTAGQFPSNACIGEDVRHNRASFQYIVDHHLYSRDGLGAVAQNHLDLNFPPSSIDTKSDWVNIETLQAWQIYKYNLSQIKRMYYTQNFKSGGKIFEYALLGLHLRMKHDGKWLWADFENELNPGRCDDIGCHDTFGAVLADVDAKNTYSASGGEMNGNGHYGECVKSPAAKKVLKEAEARSVWYHYCLKGSQTTFVDANGRASLLGNSVIERINSNVPVRRSSCISCHAYAAFKGDGTSHAVPDSPVGAVDPTSIAGMVSADFSWAMTKAR